MNELPLLMPAEIKQTVARTQVFRTKTLHKNVYGLMVNPPVSVNVGACVWPGGMPKVTTTFCAPVVALAGIVKFASTVP
jgi:hypothetical protein